MQSDKKIGIIDFGGQYAHLIASRIRRLGAFSVLLSNHEKMETYSQCCGLIFSGGPESVYSENSPGIPQEIFSLGIPILGICYGHQLIVKSLGGKVDQSTLHEYGRAILNIQTDSGSPLTYGLRNQETVWMSHGDEVSKLPAGFKVNGNTDNCKYALIENPEQKIFGIQFHPEVTHTENGNTLLKNFIQICGAGGSWNMEMFLSGKILELQKAVPDPKKVFLLVSGGVDSTVSYLLLCKALGKERVLGLFIDSGFLREGEVLELKRLSEENNMQLILADESATFYKELSGCMDPEEKRKKIGELFISCKYRNAEKIGLDIESYLLGQGTIYPDTIESGGTKLSHKIKTHHNRVQGILDLMEQGKIIEPVQELYKDEVRELGHLLGLSEVWVNRHPFPGPGLAVRIIGSIEENPQIPKEEWDRLKKISPHWEKFRILPVKSVGVQGDHRTYSHCLAIPDISTDWDEYSRITTEVINTIHSINRVVFSPFVENLSDSYSISPIDMDKKSSDILRKADFIVTESMLRHTMYKEIWQFPVVLLPFGEKPDKYSIVLRPVNSSEAMTADFYRMNREALMDMRSELLKLHEISYVFYDITSKPPGTIEWE